MVVPSQSSRVLFVDLNNFARYPTQSVGYLVAPLRQAGWTVEVFSPFSTGVSGVVREPPVRPWSLALERIGYRTAISRSPIVRQMRKAAAALAAPQLARATRWVARRFVQRLDDGAQVNAVLISAYLMYHPLCEAMAAACAERGIPVLLGSAAFAQPEVVREWLPMRGVTAIAAGELELELPEILRAMTAGEDLTQFPGLWVSKDCELKGSVAPPRPALDRLPFPDYSDFPWERYPNRIVPVITGRGCGWGICTFCSDVVTAAGRTYRSRSPESVLEELRYQAERYQTKLFAFTDLKLNSNLDLWHTLIERFQDAVPGGRWIGAVHIGTNGPNGLSREELQAAGRAGMVRLTTGLEAGSHNLLKIMRKGTDLGVTSRCLHDASEAGISVRTTMIVGYPGESVEDLIQTRDFLRAHGSCIERVVLNRFQIMTGTAFHRQLEDKPGRAPGLSQLTPNHRMAQLEHHYLPADSRPYRRAIDEVLAEVHAINRRPIMAIARDFEGVM
ncbi:MAG: B12-binding domain-containing radical SAM protein [Gammaproteobacteria bacterium]|nr:B12-binding domain-containing radical SAM protein [Gammaproteobacteria bacterium]